MAKGAAAVALVAVVVAACGSKTENGNVGDTLKDQKLRVTLTEVDCDVAGRAYADDFETVREGCGQGWIVFELGAGDQAEDSRFRYDDTASQRPSDRREQRFNWDVSAG